MSADPDAQESPAADLHHSLLVRFLASFEANCPVCDYNLHHLTGDRCPECGSEVHLCVGSPDVRVAPFVAVLAPMMMQFGLAVFFAYMVANYGLPGDRAAELLIPIQIIAGFAQGGVIVLLLRQRRWFFRLRRMRQAVLITVAWVSNVLLFAWTVASIR
jgi:hypothetical protein